MAEIEGEPVFTCDATNVYYKKVYRLKDISQPILNIFNLEHLAWMLNRSVTYRVEQKGTDIIITDDLVTKFETQIFRFVLSKVEDNLEYVENRLQQIEKTLAEKEYQLNIKLIYGSPWSSNNTMLKELNLSIVRFKINFVDDKFSNISLVVKHNIQYYDQIIGHWNTPNAKYIESNQVVRDNFIDIPFGNKSHTYFTIIKRNKILEECNF
jgi:hypothetical protein